MNKMIFKRHPQLIFNGRGRRLFAQHIYCRPHVCCSLSYSFVVSFVLITFSLRVFSTKWASLGPEASQFKERSDCL